MPERKLAWMRAVITGGAGFLGTHLCRGLLSAGSEVVCVDNFLTSSPGSLHALRAEPGFTLREAEVAEGPGIEHIPLPEDDPAMRCPDITLVRTALGWQPEISWREGLAETLAWLSAQLGTGAPERVHA